MYFKILNFSYSLTLVDRVNEKVVMRICIMKVDVGIVSSQGSVRIWTLITKRHMHINRGQVCFDKCIYLDTEFYCNTLRAESNS